MNPDQLRDLLKYRMEQAEETLREAELLDDVHAYRGAINRAYYAMFYAVLALLATRQKAPRNTAAPLRSLTANLLRPV